MGTKKKRTKIINSDNSKVKVFSTPATKRNLNATYVRSAKRSQIPEKSTSHKDAVFIKNSDKLRELGIPGIKWQPFRINALYNFHYQKAMLRRYEHKLKLIVEADVSSKRSGSQYKNETFEVEMQYFYDMVFSENDFPPLKIIIDTEDEKDGNLYFTGILLSVERKLGFMEYERRYAGAAMLPLFLVAYTDEIFFESVKHFLEDSFSCLISPINFSTSDLVWMLALFTPKSDDCANVSKIEYSCPFIELSSIEIAVDPYTIINIWNGILNPRLSKRLTEKQVYKFVQTLEHYFFNIFTINLSEFDVKLVKTPLALVTSKNSILPYDTQKLYFVMRHLTHLAQETVRL